MEGKMNLVEAAGGEEEVGAAEEKLRELESKEVEEIGLELEASKRLPLLLEEEIEGVEREAEAGERRLGGLAVGRESKEVEGLIAAEIDPLD